MRRILAKTALLAVLAAGKDPPIPPWMRAILDSRPNFRGSVHRSQYPEDLELKAAGALLAKPPIRNPVVVAMTTTPTRVAACEPAVRSLLNQSQPALIIVSIPDARGGVLLHRLWHLFAIASTVWRRNDATQTGARAPIKRTTGSRRSRRTALPRAKDPAPAQVRRGWTPNDGANATLAGLQQAPQPLERQAHRAAAVARAAGRRGALATGALRAVRRRRESTARLRPGDEARGRGQ